MGNRVSYYVSRKNVFTWLAVLCFAGSVIARIFAYSGTQMAGFEYWGKIGLPIIACIWFIVNMLFDGKEHFYRTGAAGMLIAVSLALAVSTTNYSILSRFLFWVALLALGEYYILTVSGRKWTGIILAVCAGGLAIHIYIHRRAYMSGDLGVLAGLLATSLMLLGLVLVFFAMKIHMDDRYHPTWGDRSDGRRIRTLSPITIVANYIMPSRVGASNNIQDTFEITEMEEYVRQKRKEGYKGFGITHIFLAAYIRCIAEYPAINRFLAGQRVYSRDEDIQYCMIVKENMTTHGDESAIKIHFSPYDTVFDVYEKMNKAVDEVKNRPDGGSSFDKTAKILSFMPGLVFKFFMWFVTVLDYFGWLPKFLLEISCFHGSIFLTSMASLGINPVIHHLYDFGNMPVFCSLGTKRYANEIKADGTVEKKRYMDFSFNTDERIVDGFYFATVLKYLKKQLAHPERLEFPPDRVNRDID